MSQLLDTGFLYALLNSNENRHTDVLRASQSVRGTIYLPTVVTTEVAYLIQRDLGRGALAEFIEMLALESFVLVEPTIADFQRAANVVRQYRDSQIDFVDALLVASAERLNIVRILTLDARHFRMFRPKHCPAFEILP
jgi:predicted nucleic acid-binding protein